MNLFANFFTFKQKENKLYQAKEDLKPKDKTGFSSQQLDIFKLVKPFTMTSLERVASLVDSVNYLIKNQIEGAFVECGVWKGGSVMAIMQTLLDAKITNRDIYLFDTFEGMIQPTKNDGENALQLFKQKEDEGWCKSELMEVKKNISQLGYPTHKIHFIAGKVENTIPYSPLEKVALLRLDTDWYESTKHELSHLYPKLSEGGVLIIDDYGHWQGCKQAVDEYFNTQPVFLHRIDYTARLILKPH